jgi:hypothetical protein
VRAHLSRLGFLTVHNRNEDCYAAWAAGQVPPFDVLVTNPPFSADHMERIHRFAVRSGKPWFLLVPAYVVKQPFYQRWLFNRQGHARPQFVGPTAEAYVFAAPQRADVRRMRGEAEEEGERGDASAAATAERGDEAFAVRAGSFQCVWFFSVGKAWQEPTVEWWRRTHEATALCAICAEASDLPQLTALATRARGKKKGRRREAEEAEEEETEAVEAEAVEEETEAEAEQPRLEEELAALTLGSDALRLQEAQAQPA